MIDIDIVDMNDYRDQIDDISINTYQEVDHRSGSIDFGLNWDLYLQLQELGMCYLVCATDHNDKVLGFVSMYITPSMHTKGVEQASIDTVYVSPEYRNQEIGEGLLEKCEELCLNKNVRNFSITLKKELAQSKFLDKMGYSHIENVYHKIL